MFAKGITMQPLCTADEQCLNFFPDMGFRPAVHVVQRDQYEDQIRIIPESLSLIKVDPCLSWFVALFLLRHHQLEGLGQAGPAEDMPFPEALSPVPVRSGRGSAA